MWTTKPDHSLEWISQERKTTGMLDFIFPIWTFVLIGRPQDYFRFLTPYRLALVVTIIILFLIVILGGISVKKILVGKETKLYAVFFMLLFLGIPFAYDREIAFNNVAVLFMGNLIYYLIFIQYIDSIFKFRKMLFTILLCFFFYSFFTLIGGHYTGGRYFTYGTMFDPNDIVYVLISLFPIGIFFLKRDMSILKKGLAITSVIISIIIILINGSRAGILSFGTMVLYSIIVFRKQIKFKYIIISLIIFGSLISIYSEKIDYSRYLMLNIKTDYNITSERGRLAIWKNGYQIFLSNPITGVGVGCFPMVLGDFREKKNLPPIMQAAHNSYLEIAAETGIFGIIMYFLLIYYCFRNFRRCRHNQFQPDYRSDVELIAGLLQVGFVGLLVNSLFLSQGYSTFITLYFALSVTMKNICSGNAYEVAPVSTGHPRC